MIRIHNSMGGAKEELRPLTPGRIGIYVCGDTVYDLASEANRHAVGADLYQLLHIFRQLKSATLQSGIQLGKVPNAEASGARGTLKTSQILVSVQYFEGEFAI